MAKSEFTICSELELYGESGYDQLLEAGHFNVPLEDSDEVITAWICQLRDLEESLNRTFPSAGVSLGYGTDLGKVFSVDMEDDSFIPVILTFLTDYRDRNEPQAAVELAYAFHAPTPVARLILAKDRAALEQDALSWCLNRLGVFNVNSSSTPLLRQMFSGADLPRNCEMFDRAEHVLLPPVEFWELVYSGRGFGSIGSRDGEIIEAIALELTQYQVESSTLDRNNFFVSSRLPHHRLAKIEIERDVVNEKILREVTDIVWSHSSHFALRVSVYEDFLKPDSYLGSAIMQSRAKAIVESAR